MEVPFQKQLVLILVCMIFLVMGLQACAGALSVNLVDGEWSLVTLNGKPVLANTVINLRFEADAAAGGRAGCNLYFGSYLLSGDKLTFSDIGMTEMYCLEPEGIMAQESAYLGALLQVGGYRVSAEKLELLDANGGLLMEFKKVVPPPPASLEGTDWQLDTFINGESASSLLSGTQITARLEDGKISGSAGCNSYFAEYTLNGARLSFGPVAATKMFCNDPAGVMEQEAAFLTTLGKVASFRITGNQLELLDGDGMALLYFQTD